MYRLNAIPIKIPVVFFIGVEKILKCVWKHKRSQTDKAILRKTLELEVSCLLQIILQSYNHQYSMVLAQKINGSEQGAWNKHMNFLSINLQQRWEEYIVGKSLFNNRCQDYWMARCKRIKLEHFLTAYRKTTLKWTKGLNIRLELTNFLEENIIRL